MVEALGHKDGWSSVPFIKERKINIKYSYWMGFYCFYILKRLWNFLFFIGLSNQFNIVLSIDTAWRSLLILFVPGFEIFY